MARAMGRRRWAIADGYIPGWSRDPQTGPTSHETVCLLNAGAAEAHVEITVFFADREPVGPYRLTVPAQRTKHVRVNDLKEPLPIPRETPYAAVVESDVPIVVQHSRLDARQPENALMTTIAFPSDG